MNDVGQWTEAIRIVHGFAFIGLAVGTLAAIVFSRRAD